MTVTRFAPSPTGKLHVGNLRPALLNWLFARKNGGQFVLRIDDTDAERSKEEYVDAIKRDLEWLGLDYDRYERQSERMDRYNAVADDLRGQGRLYAAYETETELGLKRKTLLQSGRPPVYDRAALNLTDEDKAKFDAEGRKPHWRFKLDQTRTNWTDGIRGDVNVDCASVSDPVLIREDGGFLYTLCSVCDDIDFGNADGSGLSKRLGSLTLESLREAGVDPLALLSYMARLGTSEPIEPRATHAELVEGFDLSTLGRAPARFNREEIDALGVKILHTRPFEVVAPLLSEAGVDVDIAPKFWELIRENIDSTDDIGGWWKIVTGDITPDIADEDVEFVTAAHAALDAAKPWDETTWKTVTGALKTETGRKGKGLFMPLRKALTGRSNGPDMGALLPLLRR